MSTERVIHCDWAECDTHVATATPSPHMPVGFMELRPSDVGNRALVWHFCSWPCLMLFAAGQPVPEIVEL